MRTFAAILLATATVHAQERVDLMRPFAAGERAAESSPMTLEAIYDEARSFWGVRMAEAAKNLAGDDVLVAALTEAAAEHDQLTPLMLKRVVAIECKADRSQGKNRFGYAGLFQLGPPACKDLGVPFESVDEPAEWAANLAAGVRYLLLTETRLRDHLAGAGHPEVELDAFHFYLAHQQGAAGCARLVARVLTKQARSTKANGAMRANMHRSLLKAASKDHELRQLEYYVYVLGAFAAAAEHVTE